MVLRRYLKLYVLVTAPSCRKSMCKIMKLGVTGHENISFELCLFIQPVLMQLTHDLTQEIMCFRISGQKSRVWMCGSVLIGACGWLLGEHVIQ